LIKQYGIPESPGRMLFDISYIDFLKEELKTEKDINLIKIYKQQINYYSKKHGLKI